MTLVGYYRSDVSGPCIVADLMISNPAGSSGDVWLPTGLSGPLTGQQQAFGITGLKQKIVRLNSDVYFAWAGSYIAARSLLLYLNAKKRFGLLKNTQQFEKAMLGYDNRDLQGLEGIFLVFEGDKYKEYDLVSAPFSFDEYQNVRAVGTGTPAFLAFLEHQKISTALQGEVTSDVQQLSTMIAFAAHCLFGQSYNDLGLDENWGGGFEIAAVINGRFRKIDNILFTNFSYSSSEIIREFAQQPGIFYQHYILDILWIISLREKSGMYGVLPPHKNRSDIRMHPEYFEFHPDWLVSLLIDRESPSSLRVVVSYLVGNDEARVRIWRDRKKIGLELNNDWLRKRFEEAIETTRGEEANK